MKRSKMIILAGIAGTIMLCGLFALPPVQSRLWWRIDQLRIRAQYAMNPPEEAVFTPEARIATAEGARLTQIVEATSTPTATATATSTPLPPEAPSPTATLTPTPLPDTALVEDVPYVDQHYGFNNCAPATLTMALQFWGIQVTREDVSVAVKPFAKDKNVMPYELADYVNGQTAVRAVERTGGTIDLLKRMVAGGYPVVVERGVYLRDLSGKISWMGHYQYVYGYDESQRLFHVKDAYEPGGDRFKVSYDDLVIGWRSFNYHFLVLYPPENESEVMALLGPYADSTGADRLAAQIASDEVFATEGQDQFFAWFNRGSSLVRLQDYGGAAQAYDQAFQLYASLPAEKRPWRATWYMTGPYYAYFYTQRYYDVIALADKTITAASEPYLEENFYWRARAKAALGDDAGAIEDLRQSLEYHPNFGPSAQLLAQLGAAP